MWYCSPEMEKQKAIAIFSVCYSGYGRGYDFSAISDQLNCSVINMWPAVFLWHDKQFTTSREVV